MKKLFKFLAALSALTLVMGVIGVAVIVGVFWHFGQGLPDYKQLASYEPPTVTRIHAGDGSLLAEFAREKRAFVPIGSIPKAVVKAFLSAEDKKFYEHSGVDFIGIARAVITNVRRFGTNQRLVGASTITQQIAKNFLLTNEVSIDRKVKEAILAFRIERALSKDRILELYLNEIYLGIGSYGVAAAALNYFDRSLDELTLPEIAYIAGLPKAPNNYHPTRKPDAAKIRRNYVVGRMLSDGYITPESAEAAKNAPLIVRKRSGAAVAQADYFVEEVRRELTDRYGDKRLYGGGLSVRTTLDPRLQRIAEKSLREGLIAYDRRHGWRGPLAQLDTANDWRRQLEKVALPEGLADARPSWRKALVLAVDADKADIGFSDGGRAYIPLKQLRWARAWLKEQKRGPRIRAPDEVLNVLDVVLVEKLLPDEKGKEPPDGAFGLRQIPDIDGAVVAMNPHTGRVLAMSGGFSYGRSEYNRATQAKRQSGSAFKPFVYLAAMDNGYTPSSIVLDAPFVIDQGPGIGLWKPANYTKKFYGPSPLRLGVEKSRNLMTVRLAQVIGMDKISGYGEKFGIVRNMPELLSSSLGAVESTLLNLTTAYAMLVNGGNRITPTLIDRIQGRHGRTVFRHERRLCSFCSNIEWDGQPVPEVPDNREKIADPVSAYQIVSMLEGVVQRGTGRRIRAVGKPLGGKTGTTNKSFDTWFIGFSPDLAVGVFAGFDKPRSLGRRETGSSVAVPIFRDFMAAALKDQPPIPFRIPKGVRLVRVNASTGKLARAGERHVIFEAFKAGTEPKAETIAPILPVIGAPTSDRLTTPKISTPPVGDVRGLY
ncbi:MAG: PBP1A family penicillin-binding protein [Alphaproteobacteria bacterium]|nr:PBP1A family penicillin-binding protein [Alphaproteobacteria bacterium]